MRILSIHLNCIILENTNDTSYQEIELEVNGTAAVVVPFEKVLICKVPFDTIKTALETNSDLTVLLSANKRRSKPLVVSHTQHKTYLRETNTKLLPKFLLPLIAEKPIKKENEITLFETESFSKRIEQKNRELTQNEDKLEKLFQSFNDLHPGLNTIDLDNKNDKEFLLNAFAFFRADFSLDIYRLKDFGDYWTNPKVFYYGIKIASSLLDDAAKKHVTITTFWERLYQLSNDFDDFLETTYFQKSLLLLLSTDVGVAYKIATINNLAKRGFKLSLPRDEIDQITPNEVQSFFQNQIGSNHDTLDIGANTDQLFIEYLCTRAYRKKIHFFRSLMKFVRSKHLTDLSNKFIDPETFLRWGMSTPLPSKKGASHPPHAFFSPMAGDNINTVCVFMYSCEKYLSTRAKVAFNAWFKHLNHEKKIVIGKGSSEYKKCDHPLENYILKLDVDDDYESLPQKTLEMIKWFLSNSDADYLFKIDDDCFLNHRVFDSLINSLSDDFVGKPLHTTSGADRFWHMTKASSSYASSTPDLSPDETEYCDGGIGYFLSRNSCEEIVNASQTLVGKLIEAHSFYEDKFIGDLANLRNIKPTPPPAKFANRRKGKNSDITVAKWGANLVPNPINNVYVMHTDNYLDVQKLGETFGTEVPDFNHFIFDFGADVNVENACNAQAFVEIIRKIDIDPAKPLLIAVGRNERGIMPAFFDHYRKIGITQFAICDNCSDDGSLDFLVDQTDTFVFSSPNNYSSTNFGVDWQRLLMNYFSGVTRYIVVDFDEFLIYPGFDKEKIEVVTDNLAGQFIPTLMVDFYGGPDVKERTSLLPETSSEMFEQYRFHDAKPFLRVQNFSRQNNYPIYTNLLRQRLAPSVDWKRFACQKATVFPDELNRSLSVGLHDVSGLSDDRGFYLAHFKFTSAFAQKVAEEALRQQHWNSGEEYKIYQQNLVRYESPYSHEHSTVFSPTEFFSEMEQLK